MAYSVGRSSYGDLAGVEQFVSTSMVAEQVSSLAYEFDTQFPGARERGDRLTVNEGIRSRRRMELLRAAWERYQRYGTPWAALAAALYYSTHREEIGTALDFGITRKDGTNRAMTAAEAQWVHDRGVRRGIVWTGRTFNPQESWHHNGGYTYSIAPITGVNRPGAAFYTDTEKPAAPAPSMQEDDDMRFNWNDKHTQMVAIAGGKTFKFNKNTPAIGEFDWQKQAKLFEAAARVDISKGWAGDKSFNTRQQDVLVQVLSRFA